MSNNLIGSSLAGATAINGSATIRDRVSRKNPQDLYSLNLAALGSLNVRFKGMGRSASFSVVNDANQNGVVDAGEVVRSLTTRRGKAARINLVDLPAGTYHIQVAAGKGSNPYQLRVSTPASGSEGSSPDNSGGVQKSVPSFADRVVELTNDFRRQNGLAPLMRNSKLEAASLEHSKSMALEDYFDHRGKDGSSPAERATKAGYNWRTIAENIAAGQRTPEAVVQAWINSPGHRANMLNTSIQEIGVGYFFLPNDTGVENYNAYWTQKFGRS
ncbi:MAG: CAP domain-containing protein [Oculatellaceae cyanobacterium Prado106]|nr:CAP domain-containing protein [Oculatellaceae cyanobacterium Prado106]